MSNEDRAKRRAEILAELKSHQANYEALMKRRDENVHSVDAHALRDAVRGDPALVREFLQIGGDPRDLPGRFQAPPPRPRAARRA